MGRDLPKVEMKERSVRMQGEDSMKSPGLLRRLCCGATRQPPAKKLPSAVWISTFQRHTCGPARQLAVPCSAKEGASTANYILTEASQSQLLINVNLGDTFRFFFQLNF